MKLAKYGDYSLRSNFDGSGHKEGMTVEMRPSPHCHPAFMTGSIRPSNYCSFYRKFLINILAIFSIFFSDAYGQEEQLEPLQAKPQEKFQDWMVFKNDRGDRTVCYVASTPIRYGGNYDKRGEPFFLVTNIENDADEISASSGFIYNKKSNVEVSFGSRKFYLFPHKSLAWANDKNDDIDIIKEMQKYEDFVVTGVARDGKIASDTYSLIGFSESYAAMKELCPGEE